MNTSMLPAFRLGDGGRLVRHETPTYDNGMTKDDYVRAKFSNMALVLSANLLEMTRAPHAPELKMI
jgi:hypothetical protein